MLCPREGGHHSSAINCLDLHNTSSGMWQGALHTPCTRGFRLHPDKGGSASGQILQPPAGHWWLYSLHPVAFGCPQCSWASVLPCLVPCTALSSPHICWVRKWMGQTTELNTSSFLLGLLLRFILLSVCLHLKKILFNSALNLNCFEN
jgi:hypothetical protein